jgi:hypothetical protein
MSDTDVPEPTRRSVLQRGATAGAVVLAGTALPGTAAARGADGCTLNWGQALRTRRCDGDLTINATQAVVNDIDSGFHGYWAYDDYRRHIQAWAVADETYCAVVTYHGHFDAVEGQRSPGQGEAGGDALSGDERGTMQGGYAATVEGTLLAALAGRAEDLGGLHGGTLHRAMLAREHEPPHVVATGTGADADALRDAARRAPQPLATIVHAADPGDEGVPEAAREAAQAFDETVAVVCRGRACQVARSEDELAELLA